MPITFAGTEITTFEQFCATLSDASLSASCEQKDFRASTPAAVYDHTRDIPLLQQGSFLRGEKSFFTYNTHDCLVIALESPDGDTFMAHFDANNHLEALKHFLEKPVEYRIKLVVGAKDFEKTHSGGYHNLLKLWEAIDGKNVVIDNNVNLHNRFGMPAALVNFVFQFNNGSLTTLVDIATARLETPDTHLDPRRDPHHWIETKNISEILATHRGEPLPLHTRGETILISPDEQALMLGLLPQVVCFRQWQNQSSMRHWNEAQQNYFTASEMFWAAHKTDLETIKTRFGRPTANKDAGVIVSNTDLKRFEALNEVYQNTLRELADHIQALLSTTQAIIPQEIIRGELDKRVRTLHVDIGRNHLSHNISLLKEWISDLKMRYLKTVDTNQLFSSTVKLEKEEANEDKAKPSPRKKV
jgi:hypothetical protein